MPHGPDELLTPDRALAALRQICLDVGLTHTGAELLGPIGDNAVFRIPEHGLVARLAPDSGQARLEHELMVARWLASRDVPVVRVASGHGRLVGHDGVVASFWEEIPEPAPASPAEIGRVLRQLHTVGFPSDGLLAAHDPFVRQREHIEAADIPEHERDFLWQRLEDLTRAYPNLPFLGDPVVVHGDAHRKNVVRSADGAVYVLDLERFGIGAREWDIVVPAVYRRVGWYTAAEYASFVDAYGTDITTWSGYDTLAAIRQLRMTTWLAARTGREPHLVDEVRKRIASLRDGVVREMWKPGE